MDAGEFARALDEMLHWYPEEIVYAQLNLLDSHDTARFLSIARGDIPALKLALLTMFAYPGAPMIYYGDEIAMEGRKDPDCRRAMIWNPGRVNREMLEITKRLTALRSKYVALRRGTLTTLHANGKTYAFARHYADETVIVTLNAGREPMMLDLRVDPLVPNDARLNDEWTREEIIVQEGFARDIQLPARDGKVWVVAR